MIAYLLRRLLFAIPTLIGVNLLLFTLFFVISSPDDMARAQLGAKRVTTEAIERWKADRGYDKPLFWNGAASGTMRLTDTIFVQKSARMFAGDLPGGEDAATGSAAGPFGAYLNARLGLESVSIDQGVEMGSPSRLEVDLSEGIVLSGSVWLISTGEIDVPND